METQSINLRNHIPHADKRGGLAIRSVRRVPPEVSVENRLLFQRSQNQDFYSLERIALQSRVLIIEGISGAGKDTFQAYLKKKLKGRDVYDYSEGELLHSWKQRQIEGILELQVKFLQRFVNYVRDIVSRDENAVFLLNRFHLSTYSWTVMQRQKVGREYDEIINVLRVLPVHVFILHVDENEIEKRSLHPERSSAWQKFQQRIVENHSFCDRLKIQQKLILEAASRQQLPYSVIKLPPYEPQIGDGQIRISWAPRMLRPSVGSNSADTRPSRKKRPLAQTV